MTSNLNKLKKDILKVENDKRNNSYKKSNNNDYDSDFSGFNSKNGQIKKTVHSHSSSEDSTYKPRRSRILSRGSSVSGSQPNKSPSNSNSRDCKNINKKKKEPDSDSSTESHRSRSSDESLKTSKYKSYSTQDKRISNHELLPKTKLGSKQSRRSSESLPAPNERSYQSFIRKPIQKSRMKTKNINNSVDQLNNKTNRLISAQRLKNNDLQNRISELNIELEKLRDENKTLRRVQKREEIALKKLESQDVDISRIVKTYSEEVNSLKQKMRKVNGENKKLSTNLMERDDELRVLKKKYSELKEILNDKKLLESADLSKKLEQCEKELNEQKSKCQNLERRLEITEKNHKHEIGVEIAHHKETQKQLQKLYEEQQELKVKLEEKERAVEAFNIYSRPNRESNPTTIPLWKLSSTSLNNSTIAQESPHDKRKEYDRKCKEKILKTKNIENEKSKFESNRTIEKKTLDFEEKTKDNNHEFLKNRTANDQKDLSVKQKEEGLEIQKKIETEKQILEEENALRKKDAIERSKREQKEREDKERLEKLRQAAFELEIEKKKKLEKEEEERKLREKEKLEELERKKRWVTNDLDEDFTAKQKKEDLLAKLFNNDKRNSNDFEAQITPVPQPIVKKSIFETKSSLSTTDSVLSSGAQYKFPKTVENLHEGKPAVAPRDNKIFFENDFNNDKDDLMNKLFGNTSNVKGQMVTHPNKQDFTEQQSENDKQLNLKPNVAINNSQLTKSTQNASKVPFLPWDIPEAQIGTPQLNKRINNDTFNNTKASNNKLFDNNNDLFTQMSSFTNNITNNNNQMNITKRPKENKTVFTSNKINTNPHNLIEDIEELAL